MKTYLIEKPFKTKFGNYPHGVKLLCSRYNYDRTQKALMIFDPEIGENIAVPSVMLEGASQADNEIFIKNWSENEGILEQLIMHGIVELPHGRIKTGFVYAEVCMLNISLELFNED